MAGHFNPFGPGYPLMPPYHAVDEHGQRLIPPTNYIGGVQQFPLHGPEPLNASFPECDDPSRTMLPAQGSARVRRRVGAGGEQVKFRRTRSGCYTCRNRRVKCDEARPTCERCRKGNRDCHYPEQSSSTKSRRTNAKGKADEGEASSQEEDGDTPDNAVPADGGESADVEAGEPASASNVESLGSPLREPSDPPSLTYDKSPTPSTEGSASIDALPSGRRQGGRSRSLHQLSSSEWSQLPQDVKFYLEYARANLTPYHWGFKYPYETTFFKTTLLKYAVQFKPLLYAVVGFAAYHCTVAQANSKVSDFLYYYDRSVSFLRQWLEKNKKRTEATLLTILQLGTIEEYLGNWVHCVVHQTAAHQILTELYSPQTVVEDDNSRVILQWYIHFDVVAGMLSGNGPTLGNEWYEACHEMDLQQIKLRPEDINLKYRECCSRCRLLAARMTITFARKSRNDISEEDFDAKCNDINEELSSWEIGLDPALKDPSKLITDFSGAPPRDPDDVVDPYEPNVIYGGEIFATNYIALQFLSLDLMFQYQLSEMQGKPRLPKMQELALRMCQIVEAIQYYPANPPSVLLGMQTTLAMATTFLPQDEKHSMWSRRKLAAVEALGYIFPMRFRTRMGQLWGADVSDWWLPNEEGRPPIIRQIREFIEERSTISTSAKEEDLLEMKGIFSTLSLSSSSSPESSHDPSKKPAHLRRTVSDPAPTSKQARLNLTSFESGSDATDARQGPMVYSNSPESTLGYEQQSWSGF